MTREEAIEVIKRTKGAMVYTEKEKEALEILIPEFTESEDEKIIRAIIDALYSHTNSINLLSSRGYQMGNIEAWLEKQKENFKLEDSWHKVADSFPDSTREVICKDAIGNFFIGRYYNGSNSWEISMYDDVNKSNEDNPPVVMWCDIPSEKQKDRKSFRMEVYEIGKGTTVCGQDYKCKKDYKVGNCQYIKDATYHCSRDGYLTDQNGVSWSCTPEWFNEYIYTDDELQRHQDELHNFKVFAAKQAKEYHISFVHDFEWNNFCAELLSYFNEQKPEWNEEDRNTINAAATIVEGKGLKDLANRLKSLRPSWKPSEEQVKALEDTMTYIPEFFK